MDERAWLKWTCYREDVPELLVWAAERSPREVWEQCPAATWQYILAYHGCDDKQLLRIALAKVAQAALVAMPPQERRAHHAHARLRLHVLGIARLRDLADAALELWDNLEYLSKQSPAGWFAMMAVVSLHTALMEGFHWSIGLCSAEMGIDVAHAAELAFAQLEYSQITLPMPREFAAKMGKRLEASQRLAGVIRSVVPWNRVRGGVELCNRQLG